jgi:hypothetical protein
MHPGNCQEPNEEWELVLRWRPVEAISRKERRRRERNEAPSKCGELEAASMRDRRVEGPLQSASRSRAADRLQGGRTDATGSFNFDEFKTGEGDTAKAGPLDYRTVPPYQPYHPGITRGGTRTEEI